MKLNNLKKAVIKYYNNRQKETAADIRKSAADTNAASFIFNYLTASQRQNWQTGRITKAAAIRLAIAKANKENETYKAEKIQKIENAEAVNPSEFGRSLAVSVEWVKSKTWGYNPHATISGMGDYTEGRASGCGYDKQSAAISEAMNKNINLLALLYSVENKRLGMRKNKKSRRDFIGYGSGYGPLPYFEGGCGVSVYRDIFLSMGLYFKSTASGDTFNGYEVRPATKEEIKRGY